MAAEFGYAPFALTQRLGDLRAVNGERRTLGDGAQQLALGGKPIVGTVEADENHSQCFGIFAQRHAPERFRTAPQSLALQALVMAGIEWNSRLAAQRDGAGESLAHVGGKFFQIGLVGEPGGGPHAQHGGLIFQHNEAYSCAKDVAADL